jgi:hypothetical protein
MARQNHEDAEAVMPDHGADDAGYHHLFGQYANYFQIGHNANEFLIDFGQCEVEESAIKMHTRIVTGPFYAKALLDLLRISVDQYEEEFGPID